MPHDISCVLGSKEPTNRKTKVHLDSSTAVNEHYTFKSLGYECYSFTSCGSVLGLRVLLVAKLELTAS